MIKKKLKKIAESNGLFFKVLRFIQNCKFLKFDEILGIATIFAVLFVIGKVSYCFVYETFNGQRKFPELSYFFYSKTFDEIASNLVVYDAKIKDKSLEFIRLGRENDGGYVAPLSALEASDALMGYGIDDDISFEREFSTRFNKSSFGFDCGVKNIETGDDRCHFFSECIGTGRYLYGNQTSSGCVSSFFDQLRRLELTNKKVFIKMDIEGAEHEVIDDVLNYSDNITGIVLELHISNYHPEKALKTLTSLNRNFVLVHLHGNNCTDGWFRTKYSTDIIPTVLELTYINKTLLSSYEISKNQKHPTPIDQPNFENAPEYKFEITLP